MGKQCVGRKFRMGDVTATSLEIVRLLWKERHYFRKLFFDDEFEERFLKLHVFLPRFLLKTGNCEKSVQEHDETSWHEDHRRYFGSVLGGMSDFIPSPSCYTSEKVVMLRVSTFRVISWQERPIAVMQPSTAGESETKQRTRREAGNQGGQQNAEVKTESPAPLNPFG